MYKHLINISFIFVMFFSFAYVIDPLKGISTLFLGLFVAITFLIFFFWMKETVKFSKMKLDEIFYYFFIIFGILASILNEDLMLFIGMIVMTTIYIFFNYLLPKAALNYKLIKLPTIVYILFFSTIILSILTVPIRMQAYYGIYGNANALAGVAIAILAVALTTLIDYKKNNLKSNYIFMTYFAIIISFSVIIITTSRASFMVGLLLAFIYMIILFKDNKLTYKKLLLGLLGLFLLVLAAEYINTILDTLFSQITAKFEKKSGDLFDKRTYVWEMTINQASFFGHGRGYSIEQLGQGAHNTYISILGQYGILATLSFILYLLTILVNSIIFAMSSENFSEKYLPLFVTITFILISFTEGMLMKTIMFLLFYTQGIVKYRRGYKC